MELLVNLATVRQTAITSSWKITVPSVVTPNITSALFDVIKDHDSYFLLHLNLLKSVTF